MVDRWYGNVTSRGLKLAATVGLIAGVLATALIARTGNSAQELAMTGPTASWQAVGQWFSAWLLPAGSPSETDEEWEESARHNGGMQLEPLSGGEEADLEPGAFLDASIEMMVREGKGGAAGQVTLDTGETIRFTILPGLQSAVERVFASARPESGAFVALNPQTGEILALVGWDGSQLAPHVALQAQGPAASVFKLVTAAALVEEHGLRPDKQVCVRGGRNRITPSLLISDPQHDTNCLTVAQAMGKSTNTAFARLADKLLTRQEMRRFAQRFGFNELIPFRWAVEISRAEMPDSKLEFARMAAGFYHTTLSPLHAALIAAAVANDGIMMQPRVIDEIRNPHGEVAYRGKPRMLRKAIKAQTARALTEMMVVTTTEGTATKYFNRRSKALSGVEIAGKTGSLSDDLNGRKVHYSWFVGFAPADNPQVAVAAVVANPPKWRVKGTQVAKTGLETFFRSFAHSSVVASH